MTKNVLVLIVVVLLPLAAWPGDRQVVNVAVKGLACPFCVFGLEKNLAKLPEVDCAEVDLVANAVRIVIKADHRADLERIKRAIIKAGFTPGEATTSEIQE